MMLLRPLLLLLLLLLVASCTSSQRSTTSSTGSVQVAVPTSQALASGDISRVTVSVSAADVPAITIELLPTDGAWQGVIGDIPAGEHFTFLAQAFDSTDTLRYEGRVENVSITPGEMTLVTLTLQDTSTSIPYSNEAPIIDSVVATPVVVAPSGVVTLAAIAHDPNPGDTLVFSWTAPSGSFSAPSATSTNWTAPSTTGPVSLKMTVRDSSGAASSVKLMVRVSTMEGGAVVDVSFNTPPKVTALTSSESNLDVGQQTMLTASASDADGDSLSYQWSATCAGTFEGATTASASFTPTAPPTATCNNCQVTVAVYDGRGGATMGTLALCVSNTGSGPDAGTAGEWTPTGSMSTARDFHTATLLSTGMVLVAGGRSAGLDTLATAEIYDPTTGAWTTTSSMAAGRQQAMATLLSNGRVLVAGGFNYRETGTAEVYDPVAATWTTVGSMATSHGGGTVTRLLNGKVLATGGSTSRAAELFNPDTGVWSVVGPMLSIRSHHTATLLPNGKVLVTGGSERGFETATAEVYDPTTGTWSPASSMVSARERHAATLLPNGKVLVTGGEGTSELATAEVYDPKMDTWTPVGGMPITRSYHTATLLPNGMVLVSGGSSGGFASATVDLYDPGTDTWSAGSVMNNAHLYGSATLLHNGKLLAAGGTAGSLSRLAAAEIYTP